jgi:hypothetical protein
VFVFLLCLSSSCFLCAQCRQCLWIVHCWLPLLFSLNVYLVIPMSYNTCDITRIETSELLKKSFNILKGSWLRSRKLKKDRQYKDQQKNDKI